MGVPAFIINPMVRTMAIERGHVSPLELLFDVKAVPRPIIAIAKDCCLPDPAMRPDFEVIAERFDAVRRKLDELVATFVAEAEGGPLAWKPFGMLQEVLRVEQVAAREQIFREEIRAGEGGTLPEVTPRVTDAGALVCQLEMLVGRAAPRWLVTLSSEQN